MFLVYCRFCDWQESGKTLREVWDTFACPECRNLGGVRWIDYQPHERARASFIAHRQVP